MNINIENSFVTLIIAALTLVAAMAWNSAFQALFKGPCSEKNAGALCKLSSWGPWVYAILITIITAVVASLIIKN
jgi:hypothetical protein